MCICLARDGVGGVAEMVWTCDEVLLKNVWS